MVILEGLLRISIVLQKKGFSMRKRFRQRSGHLLLTLQYLQENILHIIKLWEGTCTSIKKIILSQKFFIKKEDTDLTSEDEASVKTDARDRDSLLTSSLVMFLVFSGLRMMAGSMITTFIVLYLQDV